MHERCSIWSHGVRQKKETSLDEAMSSKGLSGLEDAVITSAWNRCAHCKHFGASIKCKASGKFYHFPCGAASGSFMHKATLTLIGSASLAKVGNLGELRPGQGLICRSSQLKRGEHFNHRFPFLLLSVESNLKYLYHNGEWMSGRVVDLKPEDFVNLLFCTKCGKRVRVMMSK